MGVVVVHFFWVIVLESQKYVEDIFEFMLFIKFDIFSWLNVSD